MPNKAQTCRVQAESLLLPKLFKTHKFIHEKLLLTCRVHYDFIIVGQGVAGTVLAWQLKELGAKVFVIDEAIAHSASRVSSAMVNPVTGRRFVKSWLIDELIPVAQAVYAAMGEQINTELIIPHQVLRVFKSAMEQNDFNGRLGDPDYQKYLADFTGTNTKLKMDWGAGIIRECFRVKNLEMLNGFRELWVDEGCMQESAFDYAKLKIDTDELKYDSIVASNIVFCEGFRLSRNPFFNFIPLVPNKGEALLINCPDLQSDKIIKKGVTIMPWKDDQYWVGSTMHLDDASANFSGVAEIELCAALDQVLNVPYTVVDRLIGIRPTNSKHRRPYIGAHPEHKQLFLFNGFGTKGTSLIPYFANHFCAHLSDGKDLLAEVRIDKYWPGA